MMNKNTAEKGDFSGLVSFATFLCHLNCQTNATFLITILLQVFCNPILFADDYLNLPLLPAILLANFSKIATLRLIFSQKPACIFIRSYCCCYPAF